MNGWVGGEIKRRLGGRAENGAESADADDAIGANSSFPNSNPDPGIWDATVQLLMCGHVCGRGLSVLFLYCQRRDPLLL